MSVLAAGGGSYNDHLKFSVALASDIAGAWADVLEARKELAERPEYNAAVKLQIKLRHYETMRTPRIV